MPDKQKKHIHDQPQLCRYILSRVEDCGVALRIGLSSIPEAGSGLFAVNDIPAGSDIFWLQPPLVVCEAARDGICDWCLLNKNSSVHPDGRFYTSVDKRPVIAPCSRCKVAQYCSKVRTYSSDHWFYSEVVLTNHPSLGFQECQTKAWQRYHKYECALLKENPNIMSLDQTLCRLLLLNKKNRVPEDYHGALAAWENHFDARMDRLREEANGEPEVDQTLAVATNARLATKSNLDLAMIRRLYCAVS